MRYSMLVSELISQHCKGPYQLLCIQYDATVAELSSTIDSSMRPSFPRDSRAPKIILTMNSNGRGVRGPLRAKGILPCCGLLLSHWSALSMPSYCP